MSVLYETQMENFRAMQNCELCCTHHPREFWRNEIAYAIDASDDVMPGFIRIIAVDHVAEMTDMSNVEAAALMALVLTTEKAMRRIMHPDKVNLASLGNMVPHVHWHVIARWKDDPFFPNSIWSARTQPLPSKEVMDERRALAAMLVRELPALYDSALKNSSFRSVRRHENSTTVQ